MKKIHSLKELSLVYSTNPTKSSENEESPPENNQAKALQKIRIQLETKHRGGKAVSKIMGLEESDDTMEKICKLLKQKCGVGGAVKDHEILLQGDHIQKIIPMLIEMGYKNTKKAGG